MIRYALFDLDETLYPPSTGVLQQIGVRIERYLIERLGWEPELAVARRIAYRERYGTTLGGLLAHHQADPEDYLAFVHDVPVEELVRPNPALDAALTVLPWERVIFTNSDRRHAERVLAALGIRRHFSHIYTMADFGYRQKPNEEVYQRLLEALATDGHDCLMVDDTLPNLIAAKAWGMTTVWVTLDGTAMPGVDYCLPEAAHISKLVARLADPEECSHTLDNPPAGSRMAERGTLPANNGGE